MGPSDPGGREEALVGSSEVARGCYAPLLDMIPYVKGSKCRAKGPRREKCPADVIGAAVVVAEALQD